MDRYDAWTRRRLLQMAAMSSTSLAGLGANALADAEASTRTLGNTRMIFHGLPADLNPHPKDGWDKYNFPKVQAWLDMKWVGQKLRLTRRLSKVEVFPNNESESPKDRWRVVVTPKDEVVTYRKVTVNAWLGGKFMGKGFPVVGDEAFAKRCERMPANKILVFTGDINQMALRAETRDTDYSLKIGLTDYAIPSLK